MSIAPPARPQPGLNIPRPPPHHLGSCPHVLQDALLPVSTPGSPLPEQPSPPPLLCAPGMGRPPKVMLTS